MRPEANAKKKILALQRRKAQLSAFIAFIKTHPLTAAEGTLVALPNRTGLRFDYALIRPVWVRGKPALRLEKYSDDSDVLPPIEDPLDFASRTVAEDVSKLSDKQLLRLLDKVHRELMPEVLRSSNPAREHVPQRRVGGSKVC